MLPSGLTVTAGIGYGAWMITRTNRKTALASRLRFLPSLLVLTLSAGCGQPSASPGADKPVFRFAAVTDTHVAAPADLVRFRQLLHTLGKEPVDFLLIMGDLCGHTPEYLPQMKEVIDKSALPVHCVPGNHDTNYWRDLDWYTSTFPANESFDHKGFHFVMCGTNDPAWLASDLARAAGKPTVFCEHYPPSDTVPKGVAPATQEPWATLLRHEQVKLVLTGDQHRWRAERIGAVRSLVLDNGFMSPDPDDLPVYYICTAFRDGRVEVESRALKDLKLLDPPDALPRVSIAAPADGSVLRGQAMFHGTAADDRGLTRVEYSVDFGPWRPAEGTSAWRFALDTRALTDEHHYVRVRAVDSAGQPGAELASAVVLVGNAPPPKSVLRFQQGADGYTGCQDVTVRKHTDPKNPSGSSGDYGDLETWRWSRGEEFSEFYIRFDLAGAKLPEAAKIKRVTLTLYVSRQNNMKSDQDKCTYMVGVVDKPWSADMTFATRPERPAWLAQSQPAVAPQVVGQWPFVGARQMLLPPRRVSIDLTALKEQVASWARSPERNFGLVFSPGGEGKDYNISAKSSRCPLPTLRPRLEIELAE